MRQEKLLFVAALVTWALVLSSRPAMAAAEELSGLSSGASYSAVWSAGNLETEVKGGRGQVEVVKLTFASNRATEMIRSLILSSSTWRVDLSSYVNSKPHILANRITIDAPQLDNTGKLKSLALDIPYLDEADSGPPNAAHCRVLELHIENKHVVESMTGEVPREQLPLDNAIYRVRR